MDFLNNLINLNYLNSNDEYIKDSIPILPINSCIMFVMHYIYENFFTISI